MDEESPPRQGAKQDGGGADGIMHPLCFLTELPAPILALVLSHCSLRDALAAMATCRRLRAATEGHQGWWALPEPLLQAQPRQAEAARSTEPPCESIAGPNSSAQQLPSKRALHVPQHAHVLGPLRGCSDALRLATWRDRVVQQAAVQRLRFTQGTERRPMGSVPQRLVDLAPFFIAPSQAVVACTTVGGWVDVPIPWGAGRLGVQGSPSKVVTPPPCPAGRTPRGLWGSGRGVGCATPRVSYHLPFTHEAVFAAPCCGASTHRPPRAGGPGL
jgi:hypothetical protein